MNHYFKGFSVSIGAHLVIVLLFAIAKFSGYWFTKDTTVDVSSVDFVSQGGYGGYGSGTKALGNQAHANAKQRQAGREIVAGDTLSAAKLTSRKSTHAETSALFPKERTITGSDSLQAQSSRQASEQGTGTSGGAGTQEAGKGSGTGNGGNGFGNGSGDGQGTGNGAGNGALIREYISHNYNYMLRHIKQWLVYPEKARRLGVTGTAKCSFVIAADGSVSHLRVTKSSGSDALDEAALQAIRRASPFPKPPVPATIVVPIAFSLK